jgi:hypothetical protein
MLPGMGKSRTGLSAQPAPKHATHPKKATAAIYWYHDPLAKLCEKIPRTYRSGYLNNDDPAFIGSI